MRCKFALAEGALAELNNTIIWGQGKDNYVIMLYFLWTGNVWSSLLTTFQPCHPSLGVRHN